MTTPRYRRNFPDISFHHLFAISCSCRGNQYGDTKCQLLHASKRLKRSSGTAGCSSRFTVKTALWGSVRAGFTVGNGPRKRWSRRWPCTWKAKTRTRLSTITSGSTGHRTSWVPLSRAHCRQSTSPSGTSRASDSRCRSMTLWAARRETACAATCTSAATPKTNWWQMPSSAQKKDLPPFGSLRSHVTTTCTSHIQSGLMRRLSESVQ